MKLQTTLKVLAAGVAFAIGSAASAATVFCPGNGTPVPGGDGFLGTSTLNITVVQPPNLGIDKKVDAIRYVKVVGGKDGGLCYYVDANLDAGGGQYFKEAGLDGLLLFKEKSDGTPDGGTDPTIIDSWLKTGTETGEFDLRNDAWSDYERLYVGFHFGGGKGINDSFVVELQKNVLYGTWKFLPEGYENGLSNIYVFGNPCRKPGGCGDETTEVPEPGSLALLGAGLAGLALIRRRRRT